MARKKYRAVFDSGISFAADIALSDGDFAYVGPDRENLEGISRPSISFWKDGMRRLMKNPTAVVCMVLLVFIIAMAVIAPMVSPYSMSEQHLTDSNKDGYYVSEDGNVYLFGTDQLGRDIFTRVWHGGRTSLIIGFMAAFINLLMGVTYGSISGYLGGWVDTIMMRIVELINGIPYLLVVILLRIVLRGGILSIILAYSAVGWIGMARLARGQVISLKEQEFVVAVKAMGASSRRIIVRHLVPNILSIIIVNLTLTIPNAIFTEAFLSFLGLGVPIPDASWGTLAQDGVLVLQMFPMRLFWPAIFISITMLCFNLLGDALRDAFDPRLRR
jgi:oligopeptide transport system permease protein